MSTLDGLWRAGFRGAYRLQLLWWRVRRPRIEGAYVAVWHAGRVLLIRNSYRRSDSLPAGGLQRGETPTAAALRELSEEVGIRARAEQLAYRGEIVTTHYAEDHAHVFELHCEAAPEVRIDRREVVWADFIAPDEALARPLVPPVRRYLESRAASTAASKDTPSRNMRR